MRTVRRLSGSDFFIDIIFGGKEYLAGLHVRSINYHSIRGNLNFAVHMFAFVVGFVALQHICQEFVKFYIPPGPAVYSACRRLALASELAVMWILAAAFGNIAVPMLRPSTIAPRGEFLPTIAGGLFAKSI